MKKYLIWFGMMGILLASGFGQTTISSNITTNTTWDLAGSPYHVVQAISISAGATLTIDPGVEVRLDSIEIFVNGNIHAVGTPLDSIKFVSTLGPPTTNIAYTYKWLGFNVLSGNITMEYIYAESALKFLNFSGYTGTPNPTIKHATFRSNRSAINELDGPPAGILIDSCHFKNNRFCISGDNLIVKNSTFDLFDRGVQIYTGEVRNNTFVDNVNFSIEISKGEAIGNHFYLSPSTPGANFGIFLGSNIGIVDAITIKKNRFETSYGIYTAAIPSLVNLLTIEENEFCSDSIHVMSINGGIPNLINNCWCNPDSVDIDNRIIDGSGFPLGATFMPMDSSCIPSQVYPGDANHDQVANNFDLLQIGINYRKTGPVRANASINWVGQDADAWGDTIPSTGADIKHVDTNGDGVIDDNDTLAVYVNYGMTHTANKDDNSGGIELYYDMPTGPINPGDTITIGVMLGTVDTPAVSMYGLGFSTTFDSSMVKPGSIKVNFGGSWLGDKGVDMITLDKTFFNDQKIDFALSRTDQMNRNGNGKIAEIIVVIDDDIFKQSLPFIMDFQDIKAISVDETEIAVEGIPGIANVEEEEDTTSTSAFQIIDNQLEIYPSPASDFITISSSGPAIMKISLMDLQGRMVLNQRIDRKMKTTLSVGELSSGIYMMLIETNQGMYRKKVMVKG